MKIVTLLFLIFFSENSIGQRISGVVLDTDTQKPLKEAKVYLGEFQYSTKYSDTVTYLPDMYWYQGSFYKIIETLCTDSLGQYSFGAVSQQRYGVIASYDMPETFGIKGSISAIDSNVFVNSNSLYNGVICLQVTCPYDKNKNQPYCPKCKRKDRVLPIVFGLLIYDEDGKIIGVPYKKFYNPGCEMDLYCNPTKHCTRCELDF